MRSTALPRLRDGTPDTALRKPRGPALLEGVSRSPQGVGAAVGRPVELHGYRPLLSRAALRPRRSSLTPSSSSDGSRPAMSSPSSWRRLPRRFWKRAASLGRELGLTFYAASFIALAVELNCPYVTADRRLYDRAQTLPRVRHLSRVGSLS